MPRRSRIVLGLLALATGVCWVARLAVVDEESPAESPASRPNDTSTAHGRSTSSEESSDAPASGNEAPKNRASAASDAANQASGASDPRLAGNTVVLRGSIRIPPETPADERAEIVAQTNPHEWIASYRAPIERDRRFRLEVSSEMPRCDLRVEGKYLFSLLPVHVKLDAIPQEIVLEPVVGGCIHGKLEAPITDAPAMRELQETRIEIGASMRGSWSFDWREAAQKPDENLEFELRHLVPGTSYAIRARPAGFVAVMIEDLHVRAGETETLDVPLVHGARIRGRVEDASGAPVAGVHFGIARKPTPFQEFVDKIDAQSGDDGSFDCAELMPGEITLTTSKEGFAPGRLEVGALADGEMKDDLRVVLAEGHAIAGRVRWPDGKPAAACDIDLHAERKLASWSSNEIDLPPDRHGVADDDGRFKIAGLAKGTFVLTAHSVRGNGEAGDSSKPAAESDSATISADDAREWSARAETIEVDGPELAIVLQPGHSIRARVVDDTGAPLESFTVDARPSYSDDNFTEAGNPISRFFDAAHGLFELRGLHDGLWSVSVRSFAHARSAEVTCKLPSDSPLPDFVVPRASSVSGVVVDADGHPVERPDLRLVRSWDGRGQRAPELWWHSDDDDGRFKWRELAPGSYQLVASTKGSASSAPLAIDLAAGREIEGLVLALRAGGRLTGEVLDADGKPDAYRAMNLWSHGPLGSSKDFTSDASGRFDVDHMTPGVYRLDAFTQSRKSNERDEAARASSFVSLSTQVKIVEGETTRVTLGAPPRAPVRVFGSVTIAHRALADARLSISRQLSGGQRARHDATTDSKGAYEVVLEEPGEWGVFLSSSSTSSGRHVTIPEGSSYELDFALPGGSISGRVLDVAGQPLPNAYVVLNMDASTAELSSDAAGGWRATDASGRFRFEGLPSGTYALETEGVRSSSQDPPTVGRVHKGGIVLADGAALTDIDLRLAKAGTIEGLVLDPNGAPVSGANLFLRGERGEMVSARYGPSTDSTGRFECTGLSPGTYFVFARTQDLCSNESSPVALQGDDSAHVELTLQPSARLIVSVLDEHGNPIGSMIGIVDARGRDFGPIGSGGDDFQEPDVSGRRFGPLPLGVYTVSATNHDRVSVRAEVVLGAGDQKSVSLRFGS
jgi:uncharacterized GH25 family protein